MLGYYSKSLNSAQRNYCTTKKELLAIVATLNHWDVYLSCLFCEPFILRTDHAALTWLKTMVCLDKAMLRWCDAVNKYDFIIQHRAKHQNADALSRMRLTKCGWIDCPDCSNGITKPFADEDESVLTRHDEELIVRPPTPAADDKAHSGVLLARTKDVQASTAPPRRNSRLAVAGKASNCT